MKQIPFFNYPYLFESREDDLTEIFKDVGKRGAYILQKDLTDFETNLAKYCDVKYAIGVANGTDAIWLALEAAGIGEGDEVILSSHTYIATAGAVAFVKAKPVPVESMNNLFPLESKPLRVRVPTAFAPMTISSPFLMSLRREVNLPSGIIIE